MKWKIIFFDLDGTLVDHNFFLSPHIISSVKKIQNLGLRISIATGRSQDSAKKFLDLPKLWTTTFSLIWSKSRNFLALS